MACMHVIKSIKLITIYVNTLIVEMWNGVETP